MVLVFQDRCGTLCNNHAGNRNKESKIHREGGRQACHSETETPSLLPYLCHIGGGTDFLGISNMSYRWKAPRKSWVGIDGAEH